MPDFGCPFVSLTQLNVETFEADKLPPDLAATLAVKITALGRRLASLLRAGDVVLLKVNAQWKYRGCTNSDVVRGLVQRILEHPDGFAGEVVIANGQVASGVMPSGMVLPSATRRSRTSGGAGSA